MYFVRPLPLRLGMFIVHTFVVEGNDCFHTILFLRTIYYILFSCTVDRKLGQRLAINMKS